MDACGDKIQVANREEIEQAYQAEQAAKQAQTNEETKAPEPKTETKEDTAKPVEPKTETKETPQPATEPKTAKAPEEKAVYPLPKDLSSKDKAIQKAIDMVKSGQYKTAEDMKADKENFGKLPEYAKKVANRLYAVANNGTEWDTQAKQDKKAKSVVKQAERLVVSTKRGVVEEKSTKAKKGKERVAAKGNTIDLTSKFVQNARNKKQAGA